ncbi:MAG: HAD hydrolase-like protein [Candidatus Obscuribacterales bacterium]|jgi:phosphoglycolate phosphatase-like HAD superfamily hydrolase
MKRLILFDIDETMLHSAGVGRRALEAALTESCGRHINMDGLSLSGKTDPQIIREALIHNGHDHDDLDQLLLKTFEVYLPRLEREVAKSREMTVHGGVIELLEELATASWANLGLLTGNIEPGARIKLQPFSLNRFFPMGAYGSDSHDRMQLPAIAHKRAIDHFEQDFTPADIVIIGDAVNDVLCAKGYGARSIAVATGRTPKSDLEALSPDHLFDTLCETAKLVAAIGS